MRAIQLTLVFVAVLATALESIEAGDVISPTMYGKFRDQDGTPGWTAGGADTLSASDPGRTPPPVIAGFDNHPSGIDIEDRTVIEFDISGLTAPVSASLDFVLVRNTGDKTIPLVYDVYAYAGNGIVATSEPGDYEAGDFADSFTITNELVGTVISIDVTPEVNSLLLAGATHAGFVLRFPGPDPGFRFTWLGDSSNLPTLCIGTAVNVAPVISCPTPVTSQCNAPATRDVTLTVDLADADGDALDVEWFVNGDSQRQVLGTTATTDSLTHTFGLGESTVTVAVTDGLEIAFCNTTVTIVDTIDPVAICTADVVVGTDPGECDAAEVVLPEPLVSDNCAVASLSSNAPATGIFPLGTTTVTWTVTDVGGNSATCAQYVTVEDHEDPTITCPPDITVGHDSGKCDALVALGNATASDNCGVAAITNNAPEDGVFPVGDSLVTWTVIDDSGNQVSCWQIVTVTNTDPVADAGSDRIIECTSPDGTSVTLDGSGSSDPDTGDILSYQWSAVGITFDDETSSTPTADFPMGSTTVSLLVTDQCGASDVKDVIIVVEDTTAPQIQAAVVDQQVLWPPNHDMIPILLDLLVRDTCENPQDLDVACTVTSNEPDDALGDGAFTGDVNFQDGYSSPVPITLTYNSDSNLWEGALFLRAERDGGNDGRKYSMTCEASDNSGNSTTATVCVTVPKSRGRN